MVDEEEPDVACCSVEYASELCLLACHACELSVGTVVEVGPGEEENGYDVVDESLCAFGGIAAVDKEEGGGSSYDHGEDGDGVGVYVKMVEEACPLITDGACPDCV